MLSEGLLCLRSGGWKRCTQAKTRPQVDFGFRVVLNPNKPTVPGTCVRDHSEEPKNQVSQGNTRLGLGISSSDETPKP